MEVRALNTRVLGSGTNSFTLRPITDSVIYIAQNNFSASSEPTLIHSPEALSTCLSGSESD